MCSLKPISTIVLFVTLIAYTALTVAAEISLLSPQDRIVLSSKLKAKQLESRQEAIRKLAEYPEPESAKLLIQYGLRDAVPEIRLAAYDTLLKFKDRPEICDFLVERLNQEARSSKPDVNAPLFLSLLLSSELGDVRIATMRYVNEKLATSKVGSAFVISLADRLAARNDRDDVTALAQLIQSKAAEPFPVRRALVDALTQIQDNLAIDALVKSLPDLDGEVKADAIEHLRLITKQTFVANAAWAEWWNTNKAAFEYPPFARPKFRTVEALVKSSESTYYGFPIYAKRLVFLLDSSGSMNGPRLEAAKGQLISAIDQLRDQVQFGIVVFNGDVFYWKKQLVDATSASKAEARQFVSRIVAQSNTATYEGLQAAFQFDVEAIYLLTDGAPTSGRIVNPTEIVKAITAQNQARRESIYTIGVGPGPESGPFDVFLRTLAEQNYGVYRRVEE